MSSMLRVQIFGKATIHDCDHTLVTLPAKAQELFFYLLLHNVRPHERETLCTLLWAEQSAERAKKYLRQALWHLQGVLQDSIVSEASILELDGNWIHLSPTSTIWFDVQQLLDVFEAVRNVSGEHLATTQVAQIKHAVALYQGELLTGWYQDWCILERERCQSMVLALLDKLINYALHHQRYAEGIDYARQILQIDCARERTHRALMRLHYLDNNRSAALRQYEQCTNALTRELNVKPAKRTIELYQQLQADQLEEQWSSSNETSMALHKSDQKPGVVPPKEFSFMQTLSQIHQMLSAMHQDIATIKQAMDL